MAIENTRVVKDRQSATDMTVLTYGRHDQYFEFHKANADAYTDDTKVVPEVMIPLPVSEGLKVCFDPLKGSKEVLRILAKEVLELATKASYIIGNNLLIMTAEEIKAEIDDKLGIDDDPSPLELNNLLTLILNFSAAIKDAVEACKVIRREVAFVNGEYYAADLDGKSLDKLSLDYDGQDVITGGGCILSAGILRIDQAYGNINAYLTIYP